MYLSATLFQRDKISNQVLKNGFFYDIMNQLVSVVFDANKYTFLQNSPLYGDLDPSKIFARYRKVDSAIPHSFAAAAPVIFPAFHR